MRNLIQSAGHLALSMPLFGAQQIVSSIQRDEQGRIGARSSEAIEEVTKTAMSHCGQTANNLFSSVSKIQDQSVDAILQIMNPTALARGGNMSDSLRRAALGLQDFGNQLFQRPDDSEPTGWGPVPDFSNKPS